MKTTSSQKILYIETFFIYYPKMSRTILLTDNNIDRLPKLETKITKKNTLRVSRKKHVCNLKQLEKERRNAILHSVISSWIDSSSPPVSMRLLQDYFRCIKQLIKLMGYECKDNMYEVITIYAQRFVTCQLAKGGEKICTSQLFNLLLISAVLSVKMWQDYGPDIDLVQEVCGLSKKLLSTMERNFLATIDYSLFVSAADLETLRRTLHC